MKHYTPLLAAGLLLASCEPNPRSHDYYSEVAEACDYLTPRGLREATDFTYSHPGLRPACREALLTALGGRLDHSSWDAVPQLRDSVLDALQSLVAIPLEFAADDSLLGFGRDLLPLSGKCALGLESSGRCLDTSPACELDRSHPRYLNCAIFNYIISRSDFFIYDGPSEARTANNRACFHPGGANILGHEILLNDYFFTIPFGGANIETSPYDRLRMLLHEARHSDGFFHSLGCRPGSIARTCDTSYAGPYGLESFFSQAIVLGQKTERTRQLALGQRGPFPLHALDLDRLINRIGQFGTDYINSPAVPPALLAYQAGDLWVNRTAEELFALYDLPWIPEIDEVLPAPEGD